MLVKTLYVDEKFCMLAKKIHPHSYPCMLVKLCEVKVITSHLRYVAVRESLCSIIVMKISESSLVIEILSGSGIPCIKFILQNVAIKKHHHSKKEEFIYSHS